ncbi:uncharacterized protein [Nerophis lumbriciformis]|uniref:uncharacterized protein n=1 Tax=Nerophis lumbriciformis TaxID=546530 RepID=UPI002AE00052|nr:uncharacterized protein LOC133622059 [Nerophis lumbriciformis]
MADVRWRLLALIVVVMATKTQAIDQNVLGPIVEEVLRRLHVDRGLPMFSVAVSVPLGSNGQYDVAAIPDPGENIKNAILKCRVYEDEHVVAATLLRWPDVLTMCPKEKVPWKDVLRKCGRSSMTWQEVGENCVKGARADHAEYRVLKTFEAWAADKKKTGLMLLYVFASPCTSRCTHENSGLSILKLVENIALWPQHAVVFSKVFQPKGKDPVKVNQLKGGLSNLGRHLGSGGLGNIFRCDMKCVSCSGGGGQVTPYCYQSGRGQSIQEGRGGGGNVRRGRGGGRRRRSLQKSPVVESDVSDVTPPEQPESTTGPPPAKGPGRKMKRGRGQKKTDKGGGTKRGRGQKKTDKRGGSKRGRGQKKTDKRGMTKHGRGQKKTDKRGGSKRGRGQKKTDKRGGSKRGRGQKKTDKRGMTKHGRGQKKTDKRGGTKRGRGQKKTDKRGGSKRGRG